MKSVTCGRTRLVTSGTHYSRYAGCRPAHKCHARLKCVVKRVAAAMTAPCSPDPQQAPSVDRPDERPRRVLPKGHASGLRARRWHPHCQHLTQPPGIRPATNRCRLLRGAAAWPAQRPRTGAGVRVGVRAGARPEAAALKRQLLPVERGPRLRLAQPPRGRLGQLVHVGNGAPALAPGLRLAVPVALLALLRRAARSLRVRVTARL